MKKNIMIYAVVVMVIILTACFGKLPVAEGVADPVYIQEKQELARRMLKYLAVVDNRLVFPLTRKEALKEGFSKEEYKEIKRNISENNAFLKKGKMENVEEMLEDLRQRLKQQEE